MKVQIIYSSLTGCTERLARAIYEAIPGEKSIHHLEDGIPAVDGDIVLLGYWGISGGPSEEVQKFLKTIHGKAVGVFCTLGYYADSAHARQTLESGFDLLRQDNLLIGGYVCNGAVAKHLMEGQGKDGTKAPTEFKELRWEMIRNHPTKAECALAAERFCERIHLYQRAKDLGIEFPQVL